MKLIILQGPPASGKTTWTKKYLEQISQSERDKTVVVSRDMIRESTGTYWVPEREDYITTLEDNMMEEAFKKGFDVINDATNLNPKTLKRLTDLATKYGVEIKKHECYVPFKEALERDKNRERAVGQKVLERFYKSYYNDKYCAEMYIDQRVMKPVEPELEPAVLCDLDGTIAIHTSGRSAFDYSRVKEDTVDERLKNLLLSLKEDVQIIFISGREGTEQCRKDTYEWLANNVIKDRSFQLIMRKEKDWRPDQIIKKEIYDDHIKGRYNVLAVFDDRDKVVKMWRDEGILCNQVYYGDF